MSAKPSAFFCSFCGKSREQSRVLIAGPSVFICDECVALCVDCIRCDMGGTTENCRAAYADVLDVVKHDVEWMARCGEIEGVEV